MLTRLRSTLLAWGGALILVVSASGLVAAASLVGDTVQPGDETVTPPAVTTDTTATFEDANGDGIDDDCQDAVVAEQAAADAAMKAADTNGDGKISVSEAAHTGWTGGKNCNHGGYVSGVAGASGEDCAATGAPAGSTDGTDGSSASSGTTLVSAQSDENDQGEGAGEATETEQDATDCSTETTTQTTDPTDTTPAECQATTPVAPAPAADQAPTDTAPNAHGKAVSDVAQSPAVGGKNCNHGGAVSEAAHKDHGQHGNAAKHANGKGHGKGHNKP